MFRVWPGIPLGKYLLHKAVIRVVASSRSDPNKQNGASATASNRLSNLVSNLFGTYSVTKMCHCSFDDCASRLRVRCYFFQQVFIKTSRYCRICGNNLLRTLVCTLPTCSTQATSVSQPFSSQDLPSLSLLSVAVQYYSDAMHPRLNQFWIFHTKLYLQSCP